MEECPPVVRSLWPPVRRRYKISKRSIASVGGLLAHCGSVKVKRLFLALVERHKHAWFARLDLGKADLGKGKRMLVPGGRLHPK